MVETKNAGTCKPIRKALWRMPTKIKEQEQCFGERKRGRKKKANNRQTNPF